MILPTKMKAYKYELEKSNITIARMHASSC